jgi:two-component system phosphate regulon response regulator PhoB
VDSRPTILLVEDDPLLREAMRLLLEDAGYSIREAGTAAQASAAVRAELPALILLDLGLPDRHGLDLARELTGELATSIIALTGRAGAEERRRCLEAGCRDYLAKPVEPSELLAKIQELIDAV